MAFLVLILILIAQLFQVCPSLAAADSVQASLSTNADNLTALSTITAPPWASAPDYRGTSNILYSCLITLVACIYTAIHLNVPKAHQSKARLLLDKAKWVTVALLAPEVVLYIALSQFLEARKLVMDLNEIQAKRPEYKNMPKFDLKYGFFVAMGGLVVDISDIADDHEKVTLTSDGVRMLAEHGNHFLRISRETIEDRSKADVIQKGLVIVQVTWMVIQCSARKAYGLPLTLLEIHTMVHVICAIIMYLFWMEKPLDIRAAEPADTQRADTIVALMAERSFYAKGQLKIYASKAEGQGSIHPDRIPSKWVEIQSLEKIEANRNSKPYVAVLHSGEALESGIGIVDDDNHSSKYLTQKDVRRLEKSATFLTGLGYFQMPADYKYTGFSNSLQITIGNLDQAYSMFNYNDLLDFFFGGDMRTVLFLTLPLIYGGIHLTAWAFDFPTYVERIIWRVCCIDIMATVALILPLIIMAFLGFLKCLDTINHLVLGKPHVGIFTKTVIGVLMGIFMYVAFFMYAISRVFIVVESFISLRHVPIGVYASPAWIQMLPHL